MAGQYALFPLVMAVVYIRRVLRGRRERRRVFRAHALARTASQLDAFAASLEGGAATRHDGGVRAAGTRDGVAIRVEAAQLPHLRTADMEGTLSRLELTVDLQGAVPPVRAVPRSSETNYAAAVLGLHRSGTGDAGFDACFRLDAEPDVARAILAPDSRAALERWHREAAARAGAELPSLHVDERGLSLRWSGDAAPDALGERLDVLLALRQRILLELEQRAARGASGTAPFREQASNAVRVELPDEHDAADVCADVAVRAGGIDERAASDE
jgi:hypothetical protein